MPRIKTESKKKPESERQPFVVGSKETKRSRRDTTSKPRVVTQAVKPVSSKRQAAKQDTKKKSLTD